jgi:hypothetical protein
VAVGLAHKCLLETCGQGRTAAKVPRGGLSHGDGDRTETVNGSRQMRVKRSSVLTAIAS